MSKYEEYREKAEYFLNGTHETSIKTGIGYAILALAETIQNQTLKEEKK